MGYVIVGVLVAALLVGVAALLATRFAVVVVHGPSMAPTFRDGDRVLARQVGRARLSRGDVVVVRHPAAPVIGSVDAATARRGHGPPRLRHGGPWLIKRIAALPGDPTPQALRPVHGGPDPAFVPPGRVVLLGDNEQESFDSRQWGWFALSDVAGIVVRPLSAPATRPKEPGRHGR